MKKTSQVEILHWAKIKHGIDPKYVYRSLKDKDFIRLCNILIKTKQIGSVISVKDLVKEFVADYGIQYLPQSFNGEAVDLITLFNTHPEDGEGFIEVCLTHILLNQWCRPTRENVRVLKKHLKEKGYNVIEKIPTHTKTLSKEPHLKLKKEYPLSLPRTLKRYTKPIKWITSISNWVYLYQPKVYLKDKPYQIKGLGDRWEAYFNQRFIELFKMSEMMYLYQHPQVRGCYENAPPILAICDLTLRDIFKQKNTKEWVDTLLKHTNLEVYKEEADSEAGNTLLETMYDEVVGRLSKTRIKRTPVKELSSVQGWTSIIVICYVNDILCEYKSLL